MDKEEILLKEYEVCQSHTNSIGSQYWAMFGTFIGFATAFLAFLAISRTPWPALGLGVAALFINYQLWRMLKRIDTLIFSNNFRMREIESDPDLNNIMLKNRTIHWLDRVERTPQEHEVRMSRLRAELRCLYEPSAQPIACRLFWAVSVLWIFFIIVAFLRFYQICI